MEERPRLQKTSVVSKFWRKKKKKTAPLIPLDKALRRPIVRAVDGTEKIVSASKCLFSKSPARQLTRSPFPAATDRAVQAQSRRGVGDKSSGSAKKEGTMACRVEGRRRDGRAEALLVVLAVMLTAMLLSGRAVAILSVTAWFYTVPSLRARQQRGKKRSSVIDVT